MLPNKHFGEKDTSPDHWLGFVDGIYAICITLISLEVPKYISNLANIYELVGLKGTLIIASSDGMAYACLFFIMYELWSYHRAVVTTVSLNKRWQNLANVSILLTITILPAFLLERIQYREEMTLDLLEKSGKSLTVVKDFLLHHEGGYIPIVLLVCVCFLLIGCLMIACKSDVNPELYSDIVPSIKRKTISFFLIAVLSLLVSLIAKGTWIFVTNILLFVYVADGFWDKRSNS